MQNMLQELEGKKDAVLVEHIYESQQYDICWRTYWQYGKV
jgi:hypothetical protein